MDNKKLKFVKVKDNEEKIGITDLGIVIKAHKGGDLLECYEPNLKEKTSVKKK